MFNLLVLIRVTITCLENLEMSEFDSCQGNVRDFTKSQGIVGKKNLVREKLPKTVYCKLLICVHTGV